MADTVEFEPVEGLGHGFNRGRPVGRPGTQLGDHRIIVRRHLAPLHHAAVVAHHHGRGGFLLRWPVASEPTRRWQETAIGVLGIDAGLDRPTGQLNVVLSDSQRLAGCDTELLLDQIEPGHQFGHRVLDLKARVHLEEVEGFFGIDDELYRAGALIADRPGQCDRLGRHRRPRGGVEERRRRLLDDFLMAPLDRAFALAEVNAIAVAVGQNLDLDVARIADEALDEQPIIAKRGGGLRPGAVKALAQFAVVMGNPHALAAATGRGLDHHRIADALGKPRGFLGRCGRLLAPHNGNAGLARNPFRPDLVAHGVNRRRRRPDEHDSRLRAGRCKTGIFGKEAIARVHGLGARRAARGDQFFAVKVRLGRRRRTDRHRFVGEFDVKRVAVGIGIDRDRRNSQALRGADDAAGDLTAIGDQHFREHSGF